jgi:hypothetical protein
MFNVPSVVKSKSDHPTSVDKYAFFFAKAEAQKLRREEELAQRREKILQQREQIYQHVLTVLTSVAPREVIVVHKAQLPSVKPPDRSPPVLSLQSILTSPTRNRIGAMQLRPLSRSQGSAPLATLGRYPSVERYSTESRDSRGMVIGRSCLSREKNVSSK